MVWPGPSSRAMRTAPATLMPVEPPMTRPSSRPSSKIGAHHLLVGDPIGVVDRQPLEVGGDAALADALADRGSLGLQLAVGVVFVERRAAGVGEADGDVGLLRSRSASATPASVPPVPTAQMKPSTWPSVCAQISGPVASTWAWRLATLSNWLAQIAPAGSLGVQLLGQAAGIADVVVGVGVGDRVHLDQLGAHQPDGVLLLLALGARDDDRAVCSRARGRPWPGRCRCCRPCPRRSGRRASAAPAPLGVADDPERRAILHRLAGVQELGLAEDFAAGGLAGPAQADERRIADRVEDAGNDFMAGLLARIAARR